MNIQEEILKSIEVMIDKSLNKYNSTRTEAAIVESIKNGKYQVTVNGTKCYVYDSVGCNPKVGNAVWVQIPNGSLTNAFITGRKNKSVDGLFNENNNNNNGGSGGNSSGTNSSTSSTGGSGTITTGTTDYNNLENQPSINGVTLVGNKTSSDLGLSDSIKYGTTSEFETYKQDESIPEGTEYTVIDDYDGDSKIGDLNDLQTTSKNDVVSAINEVFQDVSDGKELIADAITDKGIETSATDTFQTMAANISNISSGGTWERVLTNGYYVPKRLADSINVPLTTPIPSGKNYIVRIKVRAWHIDDVGTYYVLLRSSDTTSNTVTFHVYADRPATESTLSVNRTTLLSTCNDSSESHLQDATIDIQEIV